MNTTTITGTGIGGRKATIELPEVGEAVVITTGTAKNRTLRHVTAEVIGHTPRVIPGTEFQVWQVVARAADGEVITDTRFRPATEDEAAALAPAEIVPAEVAASLAHDANCPTCSIAGETGRHCDQGMKLWTAAHRARRDVNAAPIVTENRYGRRKAHWSGESALSETGLNGGRIIKAPAGMIEAARRKQAADLERLRQESAARRAAGTHRPRRRR